MDYNLNWCRPPVRMSHVTIKNSTLLVHSNHSIMPKVGLVSESTLTRLIVSANFMSHFLVQKRGQKNPFVHFKVLTETEVKKK